jgi:hypothetical protein
LPTGQRWNGQRHNQRLDLQPRQIIHGWRREDHAQGDQNKIPPPAMCSASELRFMTGRKPSPINMKTSSRPKAINTSRKITNGLRCGERFVCGLAKIGMLPNGSVTSSS